MEEKTVSRTALKLTLVAVVVTAAVAMILAWDQPAQERAEAATGGPEMGLSVPLADTTTCPSGTPSGHVCVEAGNSFTLSVQAIGIPANGYQLMQTFVFYGTDLDYKSASIASEIVWPECNISVKSLWDAEGGNTDLGAAVAVSHGCLTGLIPPLPKSNHIGTLVSLSFNCPSTSSSTEVKLLPEGDAFAGSSGAQYKDTNSTAIIPKVSNLFIDCIGPTPTPSDTPIPPTPTPTLSPTPTDTPTPLPPPSERPDVKVTKVDLADPVDSGSAYTYRIKVESVGRQTAINVVVKDTIPPDSTLKSTTSADAVCDDGPVVVTCTVTNDMEPNKIITIDIEVNAPSPEADTLVDNTVTVSSSNEPFANTGNNKDTEQTIVLAPRSDVILQKIGDPVFLDGGENVTYTLIAKNLGPFVAENVQIIDTLPASGEFVSAPDCDPPSGGQITCDLGNIAANAEVIVEIVWKAPLVTRSELLKNSAVVSADNELFVDTGNNLAGANTAVIAPPPDLVLSKTDSPDPVLRRGFYSYTITVKNQSDGDALGVVVTDTLPFSTIPVRPVFISTALFVQAVGADCIPLGTAQVECSIAEVLARDEVVITIDVRAPTLIEDQTITNSVTATASDPDEDPVGNDAAESTLVRACFDVTGDLIVDLTNDIFNIIQHFGESTGDPGFDIIYDFDEDGFIGLNNDIFNVLNNYLQDCSLLL
ncbi:MAG: DUF11 domain-containing protein [Chloroflexi bacterium]|nr:DUF11 domain-containing protein [Chloroflexota bacterium]